MRTLEELDLVPAWVNPDHLVATAIYVMQGHKINAVAVISGTELDGVVTLERALALPRFARVSTIVQPLPVKLEEDTSVRAAAKLFIDQDAVYGAVYRGEQFRGVLSSNMLLKEIGQSWDPLTNLPWSNRLRDWGLQELEAGNEIAIAFVDVDDFGSYNKRHGHIVGDRILKLFAARLREVADRHNDILVRYGGDEFVIGTKLDRATAETRFASIANMEIAVDEVPDRVAVSVGFAGGMRAQGREHAHVASMLDDLINLASQDCTRKKEEKSAVRQPGGKRVEAAVPPVPPAMKPQAPARSIDKEFEVRLVSLDEDDPTGPVAVTLSIGNSDGTGAAMPDGRTLMQTVAAAAASAIERIHRGASITISTTVVDTASDGEKVVTVVGSCDVAGRRIAIAGTRPVNRDVYRAVAEAVAAAFVGVSEIG